MAKGTVIFLFVLAIFAALLLGINIGKNIGKNQSGLSAAPVVTTLPSLTPALIPTIISTSAPSVYPTSKATSGKSTYRNETCGFEFSYPGSYLSPKSVNGQSTIVTDPDNPSNTIAATCAAEIPKPPLPPEKIETITLDGVETTLYHDTSSKDGSPRDEVMAKHPTNEKEIIIAGFGPTFQSVLTYFKFIR